MLHLHIVWEDPIRACLLLCFNVNTNTALEKQQYVKEGSIKSELDFQWHKAKA